VASTTPKGHGLGLIRQRADHRDFTYTPPPTIALPPHVDLRASACNPAILDQGSLGSCTAFASCRIAEFAYIKDGWHHPFIPSTLFQYYNSRVLEGTTDQDSGAELRDALKALAIYGMCAEHWDPYSDADPGPFTDTPSQDAYTNAHKHLAVAYHAVNLDVRDMRACLAEGWPWIVGIAVYDSFESPAAERTGVIPLPHTFWEQLLGGHAVTILGYDDANYRFLFANSWGTGWGEDGYGYLPYSYLTNANLAFDAWTLRRQL